MQFFQGKLMRNVVVIALVTSALLGCAGTNLPDPPKAPIRDNLIVPRVRIGEAAVGMTEAQLLQWLGTPSRSIQGSGGEMWYWYETKGLFLEFERGRAVRIEATSGSSYRTADGIGAGTPEIKARATWGQPTKSFDYHERNQHHYCFANGLKVTVDTQTSAVSVIGIWADGCWVPKR